MNQNHDKDKVDKNLERDEKWQPSYEGKVRNDIDPEFALTWEAYQQVKKRYYNALKALADM